LVLVGRGAFLGFLLLSSLSSSSKAAKMSAMVSLWPWVFLRKGRMCTRLLKIWTWKFGTGCSSTDISFISGGCVY
jgi:hypothetical protein